MQKPRLSWFLPLLVLLLLLAGCSRAAVRPAPEEKELEQWLDESPRSPAALVLSFLEEGRPVFLSQEDPLIADSAALMTYLVPILMNSGHPSLGIWFVSSQWQEALDEFLQGEEEDLPGAEELLFKSNPALGYKEYRDFLEYVRRVNNRRDQGSPAFRLLALGDFLDPDPQAVEAAILPEEGPGVLWVPGDWKERIFAPSESSPTSPAWVFIHSPLPQDKRSLALPWGGMVEKISLRRDIRDRAYGLRTDERPFSLWKGPLGQKDLPAFAGGYLVIGLPFTAVTPLEEFIRKEHLSEAFRGFPHQFIKKPMGLAAKRMNKKIHNAARRRQRAIKKIFPLDSPSENP